MASYVGTDAKYHGCRVVALRRRGQEVDVVLSVEVAERFVPERAFAGDGDGWVEGRLIEPLEVRLRYGSDAEARSEATLFDHWGNAGSVLEVTESVESQGILLVEPATGLFTGMRLGPAHLDQPHPGVTAPR